MYFRIILIIALFSSSFVALGQNNFINKLEGDKSITLNRKNSGSIFYSKLSYSESNIIINYSSLDSIVYGTIIGGDFFPGYFFIAKNDWILIFYCEEIVSTGNELITNSYYISHFNLNTCDAFGTFTAKCKCSKGDSTIVIAKIKKNGTLSYATKYFLPIKMFKYPFNENMLQITTELETYFALLKNEQFQYEPNSNRSPVERFLCR